MIGYRKDLLSAEVDIVMDILETFVVDYVKEIVDPTMTDNPVTPETMMELPKIHRELGKHSRTRRLYVLAHNQQRRRKKHWDARNR